VVGVSGKTFEKAVVTAAEKSPEVYGTLLRSDTR
jgi:hypothetical protein